MRSWRWLVTLGRWSIGDLRRLARKMGRRGKKIVRGTDKPRKRFTLAILPTLRQL
jgi:hypothetical protein